MFVAIVGCGHGEIDKIYEAIENIEQKRGIKVDLVLCCGDFQSVRNMTDLRCMACPIKYQQMHDFHRYYSGEKKATVLTLFIGGNHEASNYLQELPYGGWAAPNIYYMGNTGLIRFGSLKIAGISGIFKGQDYLKGRYEVPPYDQNSMRSVYHYRNLDVFRLKQLKEHVDIVLSHDWPKGIHNHGDVEHLLRRKPFLGDDIHKNELGSRPLFEILCKLQPSYWFSAHLHVKFGAIVHHKSDETEAEIIETTAESGSDNSNVSIKKESKMTKFLALDKVLPRRQFLQIIEVPTEDSPEDLKLKFDPEWLAVLRSTNHLVSCKNNTCYMPGPGYKPRFDFTPTKEEVDEIIEIFNGNFDIQLNFAETVAPYQPNEQPKRAYPVMNPQTTEFCNKLGISDPLSLLVSNENGVLGEVEGASSFQQQGSMHESQLDITLNSTSVQQDSLNPDEISLDMDDEDNIADQLSESRIDMKSPSRSASQLQSPKQLSSPSFSSSLFSSRRKLHLPPPKSSTENEPRMEDQSESTARIGDEKELKLFEAVFGSGSYSSDDDSGPCNPGQGDTENVSTSVGEPQQLEESGLFFSIDKTGEPEVKRPRRNRALYESDSD